MGKFEVNFNKIGDALTPAKNRLPVLRGLVQVLLTGVKWVYWRFQVARSKTLYDLEHGQHIAHLEAVLNDAFDIAFRRISIVDAPIQYEPVYIFRILEERPIALFMASEAQPVPAYLEDEIDNAGYDFIVRVPFTIPFDGFKMEALIEKYKTPGMAYLIELIY